jgi:hypothetical protein
MRRAASVLHFPGDATAPSAGDAHKNGKVLLKICLILAFGFDRTIQKVNDRLFSLDSSPSLWK